MKFGEKLEVYAIPEWADKYIRYKYLKKILKKLQKQLSDERFQYYQIASKPLKSSAGLTIQNGVTETPSKVPSLSEPLLIGPTTSSSNEYTPCTTSTVEMHHVDPSKVAGGIYDRIVDTFNCEVDREVEKVFTHFISKQTYVYDRFYAIYSEHYTLATKYCQELPMPTTVEHLLVKPNKTAFVGNASRKRMEGGAPISRASDCLSNDNGSVGKSNTGTYTSNFDCGVLHPYLEVGSPSSSGSPLDTATVLRQLSLPYFPPNSPLAQLPSISLIKSCVDASFIRLSNLSANPPPSGTNLMEILEIPSPTDPSDISGRHISSMEDYKRDRAHMEFLEKALLDLWAFMDRLDSYMKLNIMALYKILKKRDKLLIVNNIVRDLDYYKSNMLVHCKIPTDAKLFLPYLYTIGQYIDHKMWMVINKIPITVASIAIDGGGSLGAGYNDIVKYQDLQAVVQKDLMKMQLAQGQSYDWVLFILGCSVILLLNIIIMCSISASNPTYDVRLVLSIFPIFRLVLIFILFTWLLGLLMCLMDKYGVNYSFMLDMDVKSTVSPHFLYKLGSIQLAIWIGLMGIFIADYKFCALGTCTDGARAHNYYYIYPLLLLVLQISLLLLPNRIFRYAYRRRLWSSFYGVLKAAIFLPSSITFAQNIIGDFLTSLSHPLADISYTVCYFSKGLPPAPVPAECLILDRWVKPLIISLPFYLRLAQCLIRYRIARTASFKRDNALNSTNNDTNNGSNNSNPPSNDRPYVHMLNVIKYTFGLMVCITGSLTTISISKDKTAEDPMHSTYLNIWICTCIVASTYMLIWDVTVDWGFSLPTVPWTKKWADAPTTLSVLDSSSHCMFPGHYYYSILVYNVLGRSTWALTLVDIHILLNADLNSSLLVLITSIIEIVRRCLWVLLRMENEHVNNSSRFRAMLWLPKNNAASSAAVVVSDDASSDPVDAVSSDLSKLSSSKLGFER